MITTLWTSVAAPLLVLVSDQVEKGPEAEDVKAGWLALFIFIGLALAVVFLAFSLVKQLRKAQAAKDAGVYGDEPVAPEERSGPTE
jgi:TRAP-type C4-dicarboxylate transport system permease small subunit